MRPTSTMTLSDFLEKDPTLYANAKSYVYDTTNHEWKAIPIDESTKDILFEEFCDRYVNNDQKFKRLYIKKINGLALRYAQLRRDDLTVWDPLVADYMERQEISQANAMHESSSEDDGSKVNETSGNSQTTKDGTDDSNKVNISDPQVIQFKDSLRTPDLTEQTITEGETSEDTTEHSDDRIGQKSAPMNIMYSGATAGTLPDFDWQSMSMQQQTIHDGEQSKQSSNDETQTHTQDGTERNESKEWSTGVDTVTDNDERSWNEEDSSTDSRESSETSHGTKSEQGSNTEDKTVRSIQSGRGGLTPQEALARANEFIKSSSAAEWFKEQMQKCFRNVTYDPDDAWMY